MDRSEVFAQEICRKALPRRASLLVSEKKIGGEFGLIRTNTLTQDWEAFWLRVQTAAPSTSIFVAVNFPEWLKKANSVRVIFKPDILHVESPTWLPSAERRLLTHPRPCHQGGTFRFDGIEIQCTLLGPSDCQNCFVGGVCTQSLFGFIASSVRGQLI